MFKQVCRKFHVECTFANSIVGEENFSIIGTFTNGNDAECICGKEARRGCIHAEVNGLLTLNKQERDAVTHIFINYPPCVTCCDLFLQFLSNLEFVIINRCPTDLKSDKWEGLRYLIQNEIRVIVNGEAFLSDN